MYMKTLSIDIETYSSVDLAKCGVYKYPRRQISTLFSSGIS